MRFNWKQFCSERNIHFVTSGPNTAKGNISIQCPYCGDADESQHMGLSLKQEEPFWSCWRSPLHRGRKPEHLIVKLLNVSYETAQQIVEAQGNNPDRFEQAVEVLKEESEKEEKEVAGTKLEMPKEFREFNLHSEAHSQNRFVRYLRYRGFNGRLSSLINKYDLRWCPLGDYSNRIIVPVRHKGTLVSWTARAITDSSIRYLTLEKERELRNIKDCLLKPRIRWRERDVLFITEGPFDAMKVEHHASLYGGASVAIFGLSLTNAQLELMGDILPKFRQVVVLLDATEHTASVRMKDQIQEVWGGEIQIGKLPDGIKDPGELTRSHVARLVREYSKRIGKSLRLSI